LIFNDEDVHSLTRPKKDSAVLSLIPDGTGITASPETKLLVMTIT